jgi:hypothetical protein
MADRDVELDRRVAAFLAAPAGCAFLLVVEESGLDPAVAARLEVGVHVAAVALSEIDRWHGDHPWASTTALSHGPRLEPLAREILARPETAAWSPPLDRQAQVWTSWGVADPPSPHRSPSPTEPFAYWESLAGPSGGRELWTSTAVGDTTSILVGMEHGAGDLYTDGWPIHRYRLRIPPSARVLEIAGPANWRRLCDRYPGEVGHEGQLFPDLVAVARDWDGVHLSLWAVLTAEQVRIDGPGGWTEIEPVEAEHTVWLRWVFDDVAYVDDLRDPPPSPVELHHPDALWNRNNDSELLPLQSAPFRAPPRPPDVVLRPSGAGDADEADAPGYPGALLLANWVIDGAVVRAVEPQSIAWPPPLPIPGPRFTVDLGTDLGPWMVEARVFRDLDPSGMPTRSTTEFDLYCRTDHPDYPCRLRQGADGRWRIHLDLALDPSDGGDRFLAVLVDWPAPEAARSAPVYDLFHFNATWLFTLRLGAGRAGAG